MEDTKVMETLRKKFFELYGEGEIRTFFAPGRVNLIGEHIDYNGGHVFPCALTLGTYGVARRREDRKIHFFSTNLPDTGVIEADLDDLVLRKEDGWANYAKGVVWAYMSEGLVPDTGFDFACTGTIPNKSGLSSSASLEVLVGTTMIGLFGFPDDQVKNALLGQKAENQFVGMNCGIMDQFASAMGKKDSAILLDCATLDYDHVPVVLGDASLVIVNSNKPHELVGSAYNDRRRECEEALMDIQKVKDIRALCELTPAEFGEVKGKIRNEVDLRRAKHAVYEEDRTRKAVVALKAGHIEEFGKLMLGSHVSLRDDFEVSCHELDVLVDEAWKVPGTIGARMTGGGFGGCTVNIVKNDAVETFKEKVGRNYTKGTGLVPSFYVVSIGDGAHEVTE
ncbi:MAG: galactokinase [Lachnospiraceae bacterium]|nr:galactokinase [Lachnospiraceae bacterium]